VACDVHKDLAYIGLSTNEITVYSIIDNRVLYTFPAYNGKLLLFNSLDEQIIFMQGIQTDHANYLVVVTRTACILYLI
jgi:ABC-type Mn2+/Zn2+ transport system permease subunit